MNGKLCIVDASDTDVECFFIGESVMKARWIRKAKLPKDVKAGEIYNVDYSDTSLVVRDRLPGTFHKLNKTIVVEYETEVYIPAESDKEAHAFFDDAMTGPHSERIFANLKVNQKGIAI